MLVALKGLITRQPESPGLLCLAAHMVHSLDPVTSGWEFADELSADQTTDIAETIAITEAGGTDVIDSVASGIDGDSTEVMVLCPAGTEAWIESARSAGRSLAIVTPMGSRLPAMLWSRFQREHPRVTSDATEGSAASDRSPGEFELLPLSLFDDVISPVGLTPLSDWQPDCPDVAEVARF